MTTLLPQDNNNHPIPALSLKSNGAHQLSASTSAAVCNNTAFDSETRVIGLYATVPLYISLGDSSVSATSSDHYFPAGLYYDISIGGGSAPHKNYISVLAADSDGSVYISEKD